MADSWEDWETEEPVVPGVPAAAALADDLTAKAKFEGEDEDEEDPKWKANVPAPQQAKEKKGLSKYDESKGLQRRDTSADDTPLDDPVAEKLRQQRLIEEADYQATMELFGAGRELEGFIPKSSKDFEDYGKLVAAKHLAPHAKSSHYKQALKALLRAAMQTLPAQEVKDVETCVAGIRSDRLKEEKAATSGKKTQKRATLNVGKGGAAAGLDDYKYADAGDGDDFDFM